MHRRRLRVVFQRQAGSKGHNVLVPVHHANEDELLLLPLLFLLHLFSLLPADTVGRIFCRVSVAVSTGTIIVVIY